MGINFRGVKVRATSRAARTATPITLAATDTSVTLLLHMNEVNNSTTFSDNSYSPKTATVSGNAKISTNTSKFGSSSAYFDGNGDFISYASSADFNLTGGTYTIEGWVNPSSLASQMGVICKHGFGVGADWMFYITNSTTVTFYVNGVSYNRTVSTISTGSWYHFAIVSSVNVISIYWNGTLAGSTISSSTGNSTASLGIGADRPNSPQLYFNGYIDEMRITKGTARYGSNFTPPTAAFANANGTSVLSSSPSLGDAVYTSTDTYICTSVSPVTWKQFSSAGSIIL
jgi:hypothetical protein